VKRVSVVLAVVTSIALGAAGAAAAPSAATPFELVLAGGHESVPASEAFPFGIRHSGTFRSGTPFCPSGTYVDLLYDALNGLEDLRRFSCEDGTGTLVVAMEMWFEHKSPFTDTWRIVGGSGRFDDLRGRGTYRGEFVSGDEGDLPLSVRYRSTLRGFVAFDSVAPTIGVVTAKVTKVRPASSTYSIRLTLMMDDNEPGNAVSYTVAIEPGGGGLYLAEKKGSATPGKVTMALRFRPEPGGRTIRLQLRAEDPVGNWRWVTRVLKLPR